MTAIYYDDKNFDMNASLMSCVKLRKFEYHLQLDGKYVNQTCGLCGNLMGTSLIDSNDNLLTETEFGNLHKVDGLNENCPDPIDPDWSDCSAVNDTICGIILKSANFENCNERLDVEPYIEACRKEFCKCLETDPTSCICPTVAQYSHQCILHKGQPHNWRSLEFCHKSCPFDMNYNECDSPCMNTCSDPERQFVCDEHCVEGCSCPRG
ncbi:mucin-2-like [Phyllobates terribilis]|uniref:mucin-2-like n=1 Tax=Phyllobates terribilis TaxID=111132 RepID=UPI003CCB4914